MPAIVSEKRLPGSSLLFVPGLSLLLNVSLFHAPARISEAGLLMMVTAIAIYVIAFRLGKQAFVKG